MACWRSDRGQIRPGVMKVGRREGGNGSSRSGVEVTLAEKKANTTWVAEHLPAGG